MNGAIRIEVTMIEEATEIGFTVWVKMIVRMIAAVAISLYPFDLQDQCSV
jgi:hypothetical protein